MKVKSTPVISKALNPDHTWIFAAYLDYLKSSQTKSLKDNFSNTDPKHA
jgi:hypothetical protein